MPAKSKQQLKLIWAIRNKYGSKSKAPKKWKWVFGEEWGHLAKESHILNFNQFNNVKIEYISESIDVENLKKKYSQEIINYVWERLAKEGIKNADNLIGTRETIDNVDFHKFWSNVTKEDLKNLLISYKSQREKQLEEFSDHSGGFNPSTGNFTSDDTSFFDNKIKDIQTLLQSVIESNENYSSEDVETIEDLILDFVETRGMIEQLSRKTFRHLGNEESHILNFNKFNEAMGTLSSVDVDLIEDLCLSFVDEWNLSFDGHVDKIGVLRNGYVSIQKFDKSHIEFGIQLNGSFVMHYGTKQLFYQDLNKLIERIKKFGYEVTTITWDSNHSGYRTFSFQISHTDEKSEEIINK